MSATLVELIDGRLVTRCAEEWRHECMARWALRLPLDERRAWLADFLKRHGAEDTDALKATMLALHSAGRPA